MSPLQYDRASRTLVEAQSWLQLPSVDRAKRDVSGDVEYIKPLLVTITSTKR
ncbi:hypothetical protein [Tychonema sp. LEGE 07203]|uniref:hypothetical protein n=1 Tax=Tychonema sp. LEGE 07203 TaxID=1828671 RepID=UPI0018830B98|nr:hypothetical protein [Tychonema sp. LEGE 07203]MBE9095366.1 hypothetical protein [Tychonema sp. LEGE 07203]